MKFFLSARYSRRDELRLIRTDLCSRGHEVTSRWLDVSSRDRDPLGSSAAPPPDRAEFAVKDLHDVAACDCLIAFTEPPRSDGRGGRHVEYGAALAMGKRVVVVGYRENLFHEHPLVEFYPDVESMLAHVGAG
jgi:hypothetical protein